MTFFKIGVGTNKGNAILELQGQTRAVVNGAAAATNIPVTGLGVKDTLFSVVMFAAGVPSDVTADASIASAGNLKLATTNSTGNKLIVEWYKKPASY